MEAMLRKTGCWENPRRASVWRKFSSGVTDGKCWGEPWQELCWGAGATPTQGPNGPGHPRYPSARVSNQWCSVISLSFLSSPVKKTLCNQRHRQKMCISSRKPDRVRGMLSGMLNVLKTCSEAQRGSCSASICLTYGSEPLRPPFPKNLLL